MAALTSSQALEEELLEAAGVEPATGLCRENSFEIR